MSAAAGPLGQFELHKIIPLQIFGIDISLTNGSLVMLSIPLIVLGVAYFALQPASSCKIGRLQMLTEMAYGFIQEIIESNAGKKSLYFRPLIFAFFIFVLLCNLLGMLPYGYTPTSHIVITSFLAIMIFLIVNIVGFYYHGAGFTRLLLPSGTPVWMAPFMVIIEFFAFIAKPFSLSLRLAANMVAGHVLLKVIAGFAVTLGAIFKVLPVFVITMLTGFEIFVAFLQAYIFAVLSCLYIGDAVNMH